MTEYLDRAKEYLGVDGESVINPRIEGADYVLIVDYGIAGSKKYRIPLSKLEGQPAYVQDEELLPVPAVIDLNYRELQELAKEIGIPANQKADDLRLALFDEEE
jgi:hypothetical protein